MHWCVGLIPAAVSEAECWEPNLLFQDSGWGRGEPADPIAAIWLPEKPLVSLQSMLTLR